MEKIRSGVGKSTRRAVKQLFFISVIIILIIASRATADFIMDFEDFHVEGGGNDRALIGMHYPGVHFEAGSTGHDWIVADATTGYYYISSWPSGQSWGLLGEYWIYGNVASWTGEEDANGKIVFNNLGVISVQVGYCFGTIEEGSGDQLYLDAYDSNGNPIESDSGPTNRRYMEGNGTGPGMLHVEAPAGTYISYVTIHDKGNYWIVDNIVIDTALDLTKTDDVEGSVVPGNDIVYTLHYINSSGNIINNCQLTDTLPEGVNFLEFVEEGAFQFSSPPADPNIVFGITDANGLDEITLPVGQSVRLYVNKQTVDENIYSFSLEATISDPNLGWIDNTEYDPNDPNSATAEISASPRNTAFDYFGPGSTQEEGIQFFAASFGGPMEDGNLASFVYTANEPGYVVLTLVNYDTIPATLKKIVICQVDPNDPNNVPGDPNAPPVYTASPPPPGEYFPETRTAVWDIGTLNPGDNGTVKIKVQVNTAALPLSVLTNRAVLTSDDGGTVEDTETTNVGVWDHIGIIYVDDSAPAGGDGKSWGTAYKDLQDAISRSNQRYTDTGQTWVAKGLYKPGTDTADTFEIRSGESVYGGFAGAYSDSAGNETSIDQRHIKDNPTILSGYIRKDDLGNIYRNETVMKMGNNSLLDGFIVKEAAIQGYGIYGKDADFNVLNCSIEENQKYGLYAENSNLSVLRCTVQNNGWHGIYHLGAGSKMIIAENCLIEWNGRNGLYSENSIPVIRNNQIGFNGAGSSDIDSYYGLRLADPNTGYDVRNNTVIYNVNEGIRVAAADPNVPVDIYNCILWGNNGNTDEQLKGDIAAWYSCVYDPNNIHTDPADPNYNISCDPNFAYDGDPNVVIYHLMPDSPCIDKGDPATSCEDQNDIDGEIRLMGDYVDMGADEICPDCNDVYNPYDWNADGLVNMDEFARFSRVWLTHDPNDPAVLDPNSPENDPNSPAYVDPVHFIGWDRRRNLDTEGTSQYTIDLADLTAFLDEDIPWLWWACWRLDIQQEVEQMEMMMATNNSGQFALSGVEGASASTESKSAIGSAGTTSLTAVRTFSTASVIQPVKTAVVAESVEETDPAAEREQIISLLDTVEEFISVGGDDAETWQEVKNLLEQTLVETEDTEIKTAEF